VVDMNGLIYEEESYKIIGACFEVHKTLGCGFLEAVYQEALMIEFDLQQILYEREKILNINYKGIKLIKKYEADFVCYDKIIVELKAQKELTPVDESQILNYLTATGYNLGLLINFGEKSLKFKRFVF
jgi:GxxExxY protein